MKIKNFIFPEFVSGRAQLATTLIFFLYHLGPLIRRPDEDINTSATIIPFVEILGPIT
jgi:hypothetical protein